MGALAALVLFATAVLLELNRRGPAPGPRVRPWRWLPAGSRRVQLGAALVGWVLAGVPVALGMVLGSFLIRHASARLVLPSVLVVVATTGQAIWAWRGEGVHIAWTDWIAGLAVGLLLMSLLRPPGEGER